LLRSDPGVALLVEAAREGLAQLAKRGLQPAWEHGERCHRRNGERVPQAEPQSSPAGGTLNGTRPGSAMSSRLQRQVCPVRPVRWTVPVMGGYSMQGVRCFSRLRPEPRHAVSAGGSKARPGRRSAGSGPRRTIHRGCRSPRDRRGRRPDSAIWCTAGGLQGVPERPVRRRHFGIPQRRRRGTTRTLRRALSAKAGAWLRRKVLDEPLGVPVLPSYFASLTGVVTIELDEEPGQFATNRRTTQDLGKLRKLQEPI
jgi:hypothetical protein